MELFQHQITCVEFLVGAQHAINADDMGLGKSLEALLTVEELKCRRILIICLNSNKYNWQDEINQWLPGNDVTIVGATKKDKFDDREEQIKAGARFTIINYELVGTITRTEKDDTGTVIKKTVDMRHRLTLVKEKWDAIIIDEAHKVRNRTSKAFKGVQTIITNSKPRVIIPMTGTPFYTKVDNLWPLLHFVDRKRFSSFYTWAEQHCHIKYIPFSPYPKVEKIKDIPALKEELGTIMLRRLKEDVLDLPPRTFVNIDVDLDDKHRRIYDKLARDLYVDLTWGPNGELELDSEWQFDLGAIEPEWDPSALKTINTVNIISLIARQKQIAVSADLLDPNSEALTGAKIDAVLDLIDGAGDQKIVLFSQYAQAIRRLDTLIDKKLGTYGTFITGKTKLNVRQDRVREFQEDDKCRYFLCTYQVGGTGLTLTAGSLVATLDLMWAPGDNNQAIDRVQRIGQTRAVTVYNINARNTIEDKILKVLGDRTKIFSQALPTSTIMSIAKEQLSEEAKEILRRGK